MAFKVNYGLERAERNRVKQAKKEAKLRARKENTGEEVASDSDETSPPEAEDQQGEP